MSIKIVNTNNGTDFSTLIPAITVDISGNYIDFGDSPVVGSGVVGPASSTLNAVPVFADTNGNLLKNSTMIYSETGSVGGTPLLSIPHETYIQAGEGITGVSGTLIIDSSSTTINSYSGLSTSSFGDNITLTANGELALAGTVQTKLIGNDILLGANSASGTITLESKWIVPTASGTREIGTVDLPFLNVWTRNINMHQMSGLSNIQVMSNLEFDNSNIIITPINIGSGNTTDANDQVNIGFSNITSGVNITAIGQNNKAGIHPTLSGVNSTAVGSDNVAGSYGVAVGDTNNSVSPDGWVGNSAVGYQNTSQGRDTQAFGYQNTISNPSYRAGAFGSTNSVSGSSSYAFGFNNTISGASFLAANLIALGNNNIITGSLISSAIAVGQGNNANGDQSTSIGHVNIATAQGSTAIGQSNTSSAQSASAIGSTNNATELGSTAVGNTNIASGNSSSAIGFNNTAGAQSSSAIGTLNAANGEGSSAIGYQNTANGIGTQVFGKEVTGTLDQTLYLGAPAGIILQTNNNLLPEGSGTQNLGSSDFPFNTLYVNTISGITLAPIYSGTSPIVVSGSVISIASGSSITNGYISSGDWVTFNNKQVSGNYLDTAGGTMLGELSGTTFSGTSFIGDTTMVNFIIDGGGSVITSGSAGHVEIPWNVTPLSWDLTSNISGSLSVDVRRTTYTDWSGSSALTTTNSIVGSEKPAITTAFKGQDTSLTTWSGISAGDILNFHVDETPSLITRATLSLKVRKIS